MRISLRLNIIFLCLVAIPMFFVGTLIYSNAREKLLNNVTEKLDLIATLSVERISNSLNELRDEIQIVQDYYNIKLNLPFLIAAGNNGQSPEYIQAKEMLNDQLRAWLVNKKNIYDLMLVAPDGKIVYAVNPEHEAQELGKPLPDPENLAFKNGKKDFYITDVFINDRDINVASMLVTGPVYDLEGKYTGVIALEVNMAFLTEWMNEKTDFGYSGEAYLINKDKLMISESRFIDNAVLNIKVDTENARSCFLHAGNGKKNKNVEKVSSELAYEIFPDYRGIKVFGTHVYIPEFQWGLLVEIDYEEAIAPINNIKTLSIIITIIVLGIAFVVSFSTTQGLTKPIKELHKGTEIIEKGNLDYKVGTSSKDEVGQLSRAFDKMIVSLKKVTENLKKEIFTHKKSEEALKESETRLNEAQQIAHIGSWELDLITNTLHWSDEVYRIFDLEPQQFDPTYEAFLDNIHPDDREFVNNAYTESVKNKKTYDIIHRLLLKDGTLKFVNERCETFYNDNGKAVRSIGTVQNVTRRIQAEEELKKYQQRLEELVEERTKELETANKELEAFSYSVSHDLRAPLRAIDGFTRILMDDYVSKLDKEGKRLGSVIRKNSKKMGQLIDDLLTFSRLGRTSMIYSKIDIGNMVNAIYHEATNPEQHKRIKISIAELPQVEGDTNMIRQVWMNLISNAVKFSSQRKQAIISVTSQEEKNKITYCIKDNGAGFDMKYVDKLFGVFNRLHSDKEFEGTGVGLALVQRIIRRHDGNVWAEGEVDKGASFYFFLPKKIKNRKT